jgi:hypothetical protein
MQRNSASAPQKQARERGPEDATAAARRSRAASPQRNATQAKQPNQDLRQFRPMHRLRSAHHLARLVLVWFALSLGVAVASPLVNPQATELICTGTGAVKVLVQTDEGVKEVSGITLDCPLCAHIAFPPPVVQKMAEAPHPLAYALRPVPAAHIAARTAAPLPARGPPQAL